MAEVVEENNPEEIPLDVLCRFCWASESTVENPLFSGCQCKGTTKFIHY